MLEPYYGGSHQAWLDGYRKHSRHEIQLLTLPAQFWKWRMQGGAVTLARQFLQSDIPTPDVIIASDMMDLSIFRAMTRHKTASIPHVIYFHENQLTYPQNRRQQHGWQYGFINYASTMTADAILFNSQFHLDTFFDELPRMLKHFADYNELDTIDELKARASVLPLGLDLKRFDAYKASNKQTDSPIILWNHRWEEDKNPKAFFQALYTLAEDDFDFQVILAGENFSQQPAHFEDAKRRLGERIIHHGYADSFAEYARLLWSADYVVSTAYQDFFGIAVSEAIYSGCIPLLAKRLNYPYLIPEDYHAQCLFAEGKLATLLRHHLAGKFDVEPSPLREHIAQYDWTRMVNQYDDLFEQMGR